MLLKWSSQVIPKLISVSNLRQDDIGVLVKGKRTSTYVSSGNENIPDIECVTVSRRPIIREICVKRF